MADQEPTWPGPSTPPMAWALWFVLMALGAFAAAVAVLWAVVMLITGGAR